MTIGKPPASEYRLAVSIRIVHLLIVLVLAPSSVWGQAAPNESVRVFDDEEAIDFAVRNNPLMGANDAAIAGAEERLSAAWGVYIPKVKLRSFFSALPRIEGDAIASYTDDSWGEWGPFARVQVTTTSPIFAFGQLEALRNLARSDQRIAAIRKSMVEGELRYQVKRAIEGWRLAHQLELVLKEGRDILQRARDRLEELEEEDDESYDQIEALKLKVFESELQKRELEIAEGRVAAEGGLRVALGLPFGERIELANYELTPRGEELPDVEKLIQRAMDKSGVVREARETVRRREIELEQKTAKFYPSFGIDSYYRFAIAPSVENQTSPFAYDPYNQHEIGVGLTMSMDINLGQTIAQKNEAEARVRGANSRFRQAMNEATQRITSSHLEVVESRKLQASNQRAFRAARGWLMAKSDLYEAGLCGIDDVQDALVSYFDRKVGHLRAIHDANVAFAMLEWFAGPEKNSASE